MATNGSSKDRELLPIGTQAPDFSLHATLPLPLVEAAQRGGWAEPHYLVHAGQAPPTVVMLYAPRDETERRVILRLVRASYEFALGDGNRPTADSGGHAD